MARIVLTRRSRSDLAEIVLYIRRDNRTAAKHLLAEINRTLHRLAEFPEMGPLRPELANALRSLPLGNYVLFYRPRKDGIELTRVLHGARDLQRLFKRK
jgi:toxin ParE1/3/4